MGALPSSRDLTPIVTAVGVALPHRLRTPRYHDLNFNRTPRQKNSWTNNGWNKEKKTYCRKKQTCHLPHVEMAYWPVNRDVSYFSSKQAVPRVFGGDGCT